MALHLKIIGTIFILLAGIHTIFPKYFNWKKELVPLTLINRQLMYVHTFFVAFIVFLMGFLCLTETQEILATTLGHHLAFGMFLFWFARLIFQLFIYSPQLWRGKVFETTVHIIFILLWLYVSVIFLIIYLL